MLASPNTEHKLASPQQASIFPCCKYAVSWIFFLFSNEDPEGPGNRATTTSDLIDLRWGPLYREVPKY